MDSETFQDFQRVIDQMEGQTNRRKLELITELFQKHFEKQKEILFITKREFELIVSNAKNNVSNENYNIAWISDYEKIDYEDINKIILLKSILQYLNSKEVTNKEVKFLTKEL